MTQHSFFFLWFILQQNVTPTHLFDAPPKLWLLRNFTFYSHLSVRITKDICKMSFLASAQKDDKKWFISLNICFVNEPTKIKFELHICKSWHDSNNLLNCIVRKCQAVFLHAPLQRKEHNLSPPIKLCDTVSTSFTFFNSMRYLLKCLTEQ